MGHQNILPYTDTVSNDSLVVNPDSGCHTHLRELCDESGAKIMQGDHPRDEHIRKPINTTLTTLKL